MSKIYYPILCIDSTHEIVVMPCEDQQALWKHCYELMRLYNDRIEGFHIYAISVDSDAAFIDRINLLDTVRMLRNKLCLPLEESYINWLFTLEAEALQIIINELMIQDFARKN